MADETNETAMVRAMRGRTFDVSIDSGERTYTTIPVRPADSTDEDAQWKHTTSSLFTQRHPNAYRVIPVKPAPTFDTSEGTPGLRREEVLAHSLAKMMALTILGGLSDGIQTALIEFDKEMRDGDPDEVIDPALAKVHRGIMADMGQFERLIEGKSEYQASLTILRRLGFALDWAPAESLGGESHDED